MSRLDAAYLSAVNRGDLVRAGEMVAAAANDAGFVVGPVYHGTKDMSGFTVFRQSDDIERANVGFHFGSLEQAKYRVHGDGNEAGAWRLIPAFLSGNFAPMADVGGFEPHAIADWMVEQKWCSKRRRDAVYADTESIYTTNELMAVYEKFIYPEFSKRGYDGFFYDNEVEGAGTSYCVFSNTQIKLAEPVVYDDNGEIVPLTRRFLSGCDIRGDASPRLAGKNQSPVRRNARNLLH